MRKEYIAKWSYEVLTRQKLIENPLKAYVWPIYCSSYPFNQYASYIASIYFIVEISYYYSNKLFKRLKQIIYNSFEYSVVLLLI